MLCNAMCVYMVLALPLFNNLCCLAERYRLQKFTMILPAFITIGKCLRHTNDCLRMLVAVDEWLQMHSDVTIFNTCSRSH